MTEIEIKDHWEAMTKVANAIINPELMKEADLLTESLLAGGVGALGSGVLSAMKPADDPNEPASAKVKRVLRDSLLGGGLVGGGWALGNKALDMFKGGPDINTAKPAPSTTSQVMHGAGALGGAWMGGSLLSSLAGHANYNGKLGIGGEGGIIGNQFRESLGKMINEKIHSTPAAAPALTKLHEQMTTNTSSASIGNNQYKILPTTMADMKAMLHPANSEKPLFAPDEFKPLEGLNKSVSTGNTNYAPGVKNKVVSIASKLLGGLLGLSGSQALISTGEGAVHNLGL